MLKNISTEAKASQYFHQKGEPILVSPLILREYGCGQIDLARLKPGEYIQICEVKSHSDLSRRQLYRLKKSANLLGEIFHLTVIGYLWKKTKPQVSRIF